MRKNEKEAENKEKFEFSAVTFTPSGIIIPDIVEKRSNRGWVMWGDDNKMPDYLWDNYLKCSNLQTIVNTITDYTMGEGVTVEGVDEKGIEEEIEKMVFDYVLFGGFTMECIRNREGNVVTIKHINIQWVRVSEDFKEAWISPKWGSYTGKDVVKLPLYDPNEKQSHFILYYKGPISRSINPIPMYVSSLKSIAILNNVRNFHLKNLENGFTSSVVISLNNGIIKQREMERIKDEIVKNHTGSSNAGNFILLNAQDKEHAPTILRLNADNFGDLYKALSESSVNDIYTAFRINPVLLGVNIPSGFQAVEYENIFNLYYRTVILPIQNHFKKEFRKVGVVLGFSKFKINWSE